MYRFLISIAVAVAGYLLCPAADVARVTVNGVPVEKAVAALSFSGDRVTVHFGDSDTMEADLDQVLLAFADNGTSSVSELAALSVFRYEGIVGDVLSVSGLSENATLSVFDLSGKSVYGPVQAESRMEINVAALPAGVYVLRAGNDVVKFTKR